MDMKSFPGYLRNSSLLKPVNNFFNKSDERLGMSRLPLPAPLRKSRVIAGTFVIVIFLVAVLHPFSSSSISVPLFEVKKQNFIVSITESGDIRAKNSTSIVTPSVRGQIKIIYLIPEGTYVHAGEVVAKFDPTEALTNYKDAQSKLQIAISDRKKLIADQKSQLMNLQSSLKEAQLSYELSQLNLQQMKFEASVKQEQAKLELEKDKLSLAKAKQDLESQEVVQKSDMDKTNIEVTQAEAALAKAKRDLDDLTLRAPKEGLVVYETNWSTGRKIMVGDTPWPGMPIISLPDLSEMQSITYVNEVDVSRVHPGQKVLVKLDAFRDSTFTGAISSVAALGKPKSRNSTIKVFEVDVDIQSQSPILKPGMTTSNKIIIDQVPNVIYIPREAVFDKDGKRIVYLKDGSSFDERQVETGVKSENYVVVSKGLTPGEEVALIDPHLRLNQLEDQESGPQNASSPMPVGN